MKKINYYFPLHFDGGNRGCEGIAKGTAEILQMPKEQMIAYSRDISLDRFLGIDRFYNLIPQKDITLLDKIFRKVEMSFLKDRSNEVFYKYFYRTFMNLMSEHDIMFSTGGDMLCYKDNMVNTTNNIAHRKGIKTVLWGASMGEKNLTSAKLDTLGKFSLVYARESLSYEFFKKLGLKRVVCLPDPAFVLKPEKTSLPNCFNNADVIGVNLSNYVLGGFNLDNNTSFGKQVKELFDFIFTNTDMNILIIPHVFWKGQDDRIVARNIFEEYKDTGRISILESERLNYLQIRYIISQCRAFIGARTHAVISAYSVCIPTIAIGYSVKSIGIAKDLGLDLQLTVDSRNSDKSNLVGSLKFLIDHYDSIVNHMNEVIPDYRIKPYEAKSLIEAL